MHDSLAQESPSVRQRGFVAGIVVLALLTITRFVLGWLIAPFVTSHPARIARIYAGDDAQDDGGPRSARQAPD